MVSAPWWTDVTSLLPMRCISRTLPDTMWLTCPFIV